MATRRLSRGTPATLTKAEQEDFVRLLDEDPALRDTLSTITGRELDSLTFGEKLAALHRLQESGRALQVVSAAARARRDAENIAHEIRGDVALSDEVADLKRRLDERDAELLVAGERAAAAEQQLQAQRATAVSRRARSAQAVNSGEKVPA